MKPQVPVYIVAVICGSLLAFGVLVDGRVLLAAIAPLLLLRSFLLQAGSVLGPADGGLILARIALLLRADPNARCKAFLLMPALDLLFHPRLTPIPPHDYQRQERERPFALRGMEWRRRARGAAPRPRGRARMPRREEVDAAHEGQPRWARRSGASPPRRRGGPGRSRRRRPRRADACGVERPRGRGGGPARGRG